MSDKVVAKTLHPLGDGYKFHISGFGEDYLVVIIDTGQYCENCQGDGVRRFDMLEGNILFIFQDTGDGDPYWIRTKPNHRCIWSRDAEKVFAGSKTKTEEGFVVTYHSLPMIFSEVVEMIDHCIAENERDRRLYGLIGTLRKAIKDVDPAQHEDIMRLMRTTAGEDFQLVTEAIDNVKKEMGKAKE